MFQYIPKFSKIIGTKFDRYIWETPDKYKLMIASEDPNKDCMHIVRHRCLLESSLELQHDLNPDEGCRVVEVSPPDDEYDLELESTFPVK